jgi:hypothetical protein
MSVSPVELEAELLSLGGGEGVGSMPERLGFGVAKVGAAFASKPDPSARGAKVFEA